jgi:O-antigen/teichoic acid export membrane protein
MSPQAGPPSLTQQAAHGVKWTTTSMVVVTLLQFAQLAVLARLLSKADFGLMAMISVLLAIGLAYADMGLSNALIWRQDATRNQLSSLYWVNILAGLGVFVVTLAFTPLFAALLKQPRLEIYLPWAALVFVLLPWGQEFQVLLQKELRFRILAMIEIAAAAVGTATAIFAALAGLSVFALIAGLLAGAGTRAAGLSVVGWKRWRPILRLRFGDLRGYMKFGLYQMGERTLNELTANIDYLLIGRFLGSVALGLYSVAYQLVVFPFQRINPVLTRVAFPVFSLRQDDDEAVSKGFCQLSEMLVFLVFPLLVGLLVTAPVMVPVLFGRKWVGAVPIVQVLSLMAMVKTLANPMGAVLLAKGRADLGFRINGVQVVLTLVVFLVAVRFGTLAVAWAWVGISLVSFVVWQPVVLRVIHLAVRDYLRALARPMLLTALLGLSLEAVYLALRSVVGSSLVLLGLLVAAGTFIHLGIWLLFDRRFVAYTYAMLRVARSAAT